MTSLVRAKKFAQKRERRSFVAHIKVGTDTDAGDIPVADGNYHLGNLPPDAIVLDSFAQVITAFGAATAAATVGTTSGGTEIASSIDLATVAFDGTFTGKLNTGTGKEVWLNVDVGTVTGATLGEAILVIDYLEYTVTNGEYTSMAEA